MLAILFAGRKLLNSCDGSSSNSSISTSAMMEIVEKLKHQQHRDSTKKNYYSVWHSFNKFFIRLDIKPNNWEDRLTLYVAFLIENNKKSTTVKSYISAIKVILAENNIQLKEDAYLLEALTRACKLNNDRVHVHLPIRQGVTSACDPTTLRFVSISDLSEETI